MEDSSGHFDLGDIGVVFFHKDGFSTACGHGTVAQTRWAVDTGRIAAPVNGKVLVRTDPR